MENRLIELRGYHDSSVVVSGGDISVVTRDPDQDHSIVILRNGTQLGVLETPKEIFNKMEGEGK